MAEIVNISSSSSSSFESLTSWSNNTISGSPPPPQAPQQEFVLPHPMHPIHHQPQPRPNPGRALDLAKACISDPQFQFAISMKKSFVEDDCRLPLPFTHADHFLWQNVDEMITLSYGNRMWECALKFSQMQYRLGAGWRDFVEGTGLAKHDAVFFKRVYLSDNSAIYKLKIFKAT